MDVDQPAPPIVLPDRFDLQAYARNYTGHAKIDRLVFIAKIAAGHPLELEALKAAHDEIKRASDNTHLYKEVVALLDGRAGDAYALDSVWIEDHDRQFAQRRDALEADLTAAKTNMVKEAVRLAHTALGDAHYARGEVDVAFKQYLRTRDYTTAPSQMVDMCVNVVRCALEMKQFMHVGPYVTKAEALEGFGVAPVALAKLRCAQGLAHLAAGKYAAAARTLTSLPSDLGNAFRDVVSGGDVATYGTLCALATMGRSELAASVVDSPSFRELLTLAPPGVQSAARDFHASRYGPALKALALLRPTLGLDPLLSGHVDALIQAARGRALALYTVPFSSLDLTAMAAAFGMNVDALESELAALIASKEVKGRIDSHAKALRSCTTDARTATFQRALETSEQYLRSTKSLLLRASMMRHDLVQRLPPGDRPERPDRTEGPRLGRGREREGSGWRRGGERERQERRMVMDEMRESGSGEFIDVATVSAMLSD